MAIHHRDGNPGNNTLANLQVVKAAADLSDIVDAAQPDPDIYHVWLSVSVDSPEEVVAGFGQFATRPEAETVAAKVRTAYDIHDEMLLLLKRVQASHNCNYDMHTLWYDYGKRIDAAIAKAEPD